MGSFVRESGGLVRDLGVFVRERRRFMKGRDSLGGREGEGRVGGVFVWGRGGWGSL